MNDRLSALRALWEERRGDRALPERRDFLAEEFRPWFGHLCIVRVEEPAARFRVTLAGLEVVRYYGRDLTGRCLDDEMSVEGFGWVVESYRECVRRAAPYCASVPALAFNGTAMALNRLMLPCGRDCRVDTVIVGIYPAG
ncbi:PAS domain-containing protein [Azospirillum sp.]|uniref:PAS domain-containing protein n=1 Tax=Azospirillum sp. TaxID=34012 RepID=UPI003D725724